MSESRLKELVSDGKASIIFVHGTARSGSTIAEVIFSKFADRAVHEPFTGMVVKKRDEPGEKKLGIDDEVYERACEIIVKNIAEILKEKKKATVVVKEVSSFFTASICERWLQIPEKFLFTIRDPHLQYFSRLAQINDIVVTGENVSREEKRLLVLKNAIATESLELQKLRAFWKGTLLSYNKESWDRVIENLKLVRSAIKGTSKKLAILDLILFRHNPYYAIEQTMGKLGFEVEINEVKRQVKDLSVSCQEKVYDIRDQSRPAVRKARNSKQLEPLVPGKDIGPYALPPKSREHIWQLIPIYLDMLYAPEQVYMPYLAQLDGPVAQNDKIKLEDTHPFVAYAVASFHLHSQKTQKSSVMPLIQRILNRKTEMAHQEGVTMNSERFRGSIDRVDSYWESRTVEGRK